MTDHWTTHDLNSKASDKPGRNPSEVEYSYPPPYRVSTAYLQRPSKAAGAPLRRPLKLKTFKPALSPERASGDRVKETEDTR